MTAPPPSGGQLAVVQPVVAIAAGICAWLLAPGLHSAHSWHVNFDGFFTASASVIAALLIAVAVEARHIVRRQVLANLTVISIAVGVVSAVAALCPLPTSIYHWLFALTVGGGVGGLVAACVIGAQTLAAEVDAARLDELDRFAERARQDAERARQDAERAQRDADRARQDAERAQQDAALRNPGPGAGGGK
ncbi:MAG: hypothetical protein WB795_21445 [Candidatus Acidiferrales bacterium]